MVILFLYIKKVLKFELPITGFLNFVQIPKTMTRSLLFTLALFLFTATLLPAQTPVANLPLPRVFQLGGNEQAYEALSQEYGQSLLEVFWNTDGSIDHIGYVFRTNSRNVRPDEFSAFLSSFTRQYTFPLKSQQKFSHYTIATFPLHTEKNG